MRTTTAPPEVVVLGQGDVDGRHRLSGPRAETS